MHDDYVCDKITKIEEKVDTFIGEQKVLFTEIAVLKQEIRFMGVRFDSALKEVKQQLSSSLSRREFFSYFTIAIAIVTLIQLLLEF